VRILHVSWEYPPIIYGGLGRHVHALAEQQAASGHDVVVLTQFADGAPGDEVRNGVRILRVPPDAPIVPLDEEHLIAWVASFNSALTRAAIALRRTWQADVVHGHDWLVATAATAAKDLNQVPYVTTMHATEAGRHQGWLPTELSRAIHSVEWWSTYQARRVITCSEHMRWEVHRLFDPPRDKTVVIPNGIAPKRMRKRASSRAAVRETYDVPLLVFSGRLEWEKGVHTLIDALPKIRRHVGSFHVVIAGRGSTDENLRAQVAAKRMKSRVSFVGWLPERELQDLVGAADLVVVPSIYEPFGMVALEAAALGAPLIVSGAGGLAELVTHGVSGRVFSAGDPDALAGAIIGALEDPATTTRMARAARARALRDYGWPVIADRTVQVYEEARDEERRLLATGWKEPNPQHLRVPDGNLLALPSANVT
jgi:glycogen(starch) synthase